MNHYVVTAVGSEGNITCDPTEDTLVHNCNTPPDRNVNNFKFKVYSVTVGVDGIAHNGGTLTDGCKLMRLCSWVHFSLGLAFPENVRAVEEECGLQQLVNVSWEVSTHTHT